MIEIKKKNEQEFLVTIEEESSRSKHTVSLENDYYKNLNAGRTSKEKLRRKSFEFLLERESKESIFSEFNLRIIRNYFPEYEEKIKT